MNLKTRLARLEERISGGQHVVVTDTEHKRADIAEYLAAHPGVTEDKLLVVVCDPVMRDRPLDRN